jgi:ABC-2 type transport system permease protein
VKVSRTWAIAKKEFVHIYRDPRSLALVILMPALLMLLFGYAVTLDVKKVSMAVLDRDRSQESLNFIQRFSASPYFRLRFWVQDERAMKRLIDQGEVKMGLILPWDFSKTIKSEKIVSVQALIDGADANTANLILSYAQTIARQYTQDKTVLKVARMGIENLSLPIEARPRVWFNEDLESKNYFVPGLVAVIVSIIGVLLTGQVIVREWEKGTMELLISTPVRKAELMVGKLFPYFFLGLLDLSLSGLSGAAERKRCPAFWPLLHLHSRGSGPRVNHLHLRKDTAPGQSDGDGHRISAHVPSLRVYLRDLQHAHVASDHYLYDCASILCDDRKRDLLKRGGLLFSLA